MAKRYAEPSPAQQRSDTRTRTPTPPRPSTAEAIARSPGLGVDGLSRPFGQRVVVARSQLERLPEAQRRLFALGLMQTLQRRTASTHEVTVQRKPSALQVRATNVLAQLRALIAGADWPTIRKRVYPQQSAAGIARAKDRKAGKATDLTGLGQITSLNRFATAMRAIQTDWPTKTVKERIGLIAAAANAELTQAGVPNFLLVDTMAMVAKGSFTASAWAFQINEELVSARTLDAATAGQLANAAMHESRHAEQHFLAARYSAGMNKTDEAGLVAEQGLPGSIARAALKNKLTPQSDIAVAALGQRMFTAFVTDSTANYGAAGELDPARDTMKDKRTKAVGAQAALVKAVSAATVAAAEKACLALSASITAVEKAYAAYRAVPFEADAHEVGDAAELAFQGWP